MFSLSEIVLLRKGTWRRKNRRKKSLPIAILLRLAYHHWPKIAMKQRTHKAISDLKWPEVWTKFTLHRFSFLLNILLAERQ